MCPEIEAVGRNYPVTVGVAVLKELERIGAIQPVTEEQLVLANENVKDEHAKIASDHGLGK